MAILNEAKNRWSGYAGWLNYQLMNVCVKAEPASLLSFEVMFEGNAMPLEEMATVTQPDDMQFDIAPNEAEYVPNICEAIALVHPEFKLDVKIPDPPEESEENEVKAPQGFPQLDEDDFEDDSDIPHIYCTMPEVNKDRRDAMMEAVDQMCEAASTRMDISHEECRARLATNLLGETEKNIDLANKRFKKMYNTCSDYMKTLREQKEREIEDAYQAYLSNQSKKVAIQKEDDAADNKEAGFSMKMDMGDEDDEK